MFSWSEWSRYTAVMEQTRSEFLCCRTEPPSPPPHTHTRNVLYLNIFRYSKCLPLCFQGSGYVRIIIIIIIIIITPIVTRMQIDSQWRKIGILVVSCLLSVRNRFRKSVSYSNTNASFLLSCQNILKFSGIFFMLVNTLRRFGLSEDDEVSPKFRRRFTNCTRYAISKLLTSQDRSDNTGCNDFTPHSFVLNVTLYVSVTSRRLLKYNAV